MYSSALSTRTRTVPPCATAGSATVLPLFCRVLVRHKYGTSTGTLIPSLMICWHRRRHCSRALEGRPRHADVYRTSPLAVSTQVHKTSEQGKPLVVPGISNLQRSSICNELLLASEPDDTATAELLNQCTSVPHRLQSSCFWHVDKWRLGDDRLIAPQISSQKLARSGISGDLGF